VNIYGLKIWQEEFSRIINFNVEMECNSFLKTGSVSTYDSIYQSKAIPIPAPQFSHPDDKSINWTGRLARELLSLTDPKQTIYHDQMSAWFDREGKELVGLKTFDLLNKSLSAYGLSGLDKLFCFMLVSQCQLFVKICRRDFLQSQEMHGFINKFAQQLHPTSTIPTFTQKLYFTGLTATQKLWPNLLDTTILIGQLQIIRRQINNTLNFTCKLDSNTYYSVLEILNKSLIKDIQQHYRQPENHPYPNEENPVLAEVADYLENSGLNDPFTKIYVTTKAIDNLACLMFLFVISQVNKFQFSNKLSILVHRKDKRAFDSAPFIVGVITLLKQFHSVQTQNFLAYLGQYIRGFVNISSNTNATDLPEEVVSVLLFLEDFLQFSNTDRGVMEGYLPTYIFNYFKH